VSPRRAFLDSRPDSRKVFRKDSVWRWAALVAAILAISAAVPAQAPPAPIRGFAPEQWAAQHEREEKAKALAQTERLRIYMERMASRPHAAGSGASKAVAEYLQAQLREWGLEARIETYEALLPYPVTRTLEMTAPVAFHASLKEPAIPEDPDTASDGQIPTFNAYSGSGDVTAPLVYVNYGVPEDYEYLRRQGISVKGKIVIARYGKSWRGTKPKVAEENGAVGCLIYSDPRDDGYFQDDPYPKGPARPAQGVQRGSVVDMPIYAGDPLSPGWASEAGSKRLSRAEARTLMKIPVLPISWADAKPLLEQLGGPVAPESWRGALALTYHLGAGPATVHLKLDFDDSIRPLYNVIATIPGSVYKDQWVLYGNHHDAWVNGASDPASGAAALLETARVLAELRKQGWQPKRTIVLPLWDGEEFGLIGSTEWAEKHEEELNRKAAVYLNSDSNGRGPLGVAGSNTLEAFMREVLRDVSDPESGKSLLDSIAPRAGGPKGRRPPFRLQPLGAGSDYVVFLHHDGIASLNLGFGGGEQSGVYHSIYDTIAWYNKFSDTNRSYGRALAQVMTTAILRLADAPVLPFEFAGLSRTISRYLDETRSAAQRPQLLEVYELQMQIDRLNQASKAFEDQMADLLRRTPAVSPEKLVKANEAIMHTERALTLPDGLPGREWYRHQLYAPGSYTGYNAKTLPGIREAVEADRMEDANREVKRVGWAIKALTSQVEDATRRLKSAGEQSEPGKTRIDR
jgi:N-acetylated-alpha-linked acidic dipeptidase